MKNMDQQKNKSLHKYDTYTCNKNFVIWTISKGDLVAILGGNDRPKQEAI
jgi:hypothetical protein